MKNARPARYVATFCMAVLAAMAKPARAADEDAAMAAQAEAAHPRAEGPQPIWTIEQRMPIGRAYISPDGNGLLIVKNVYRWPQDRLTWVDLRARRVAQDISIAPAGIIGIPYFSPSSDSFRAVVNTPDGCALATWTLPDFQMTKTNLGFGLARAAALTHRQDKAIVMREDGLIGVFDAADAKKRMEVDFHTSGEIVACQEMAVTWDDAVVTSGILDRRLCSWRLADGSRLDSPAEVDWLGGNYPMQYSADNTKLLVAAGHCFYIADVRSGKQLLTFDANGGLGSFSHDPRRNLVAMPLADAETFGVLDLNTGHWVMTARHGRATASTSADAEWVCLAPDAQTVYSGGYASIKAWDLATPWAEYQKARQSADMNPLVSATPGDAISQLISAGKEGRTSDMRRLFTGVPDAEESQVEDIVEFFSAADNECEVIRTFERSDCAIVVLFIKDMSEDRRSGIDGICLVRRNGNWLLLPNSDMESATEIGTGVSESEIATFKELAAIVDVFKAVVDASGGQIPPSGEPGDLVGTWNNGQGGFDVCMLAFRADGTGRLMFAGVGIAPLKWVAKDTNILVRVADAPGDKDLVIHWGPVPDAIQAIWFDGKTQLFYRVSTTEPPDVMALVREARKKDWDKSREIFNVRTNIANSLADLPSCLEGFMRPSSIFSHATLAYGGTNVIVGLQRTGTNTFISVTTMFAGDRHIDPFSTDGYWANVPPTNAWPPNVLVSDEALSELERWLSPRGMAAESRYCIYKDEWGIRRYERTILVHIAMDRDVVDTLEYFLTHTMGHAAPPYTLVVSTPK